MFKQFIIGVLSSITAHRLFPPPTNDGKSRSRGCILRLFSILIFIGLLCWALGYLIVVAITGGPLSLYAGVKFLAENGFIALDKLFYPGFDIPAVVAWAFWGLVGGTAIQGFRELRSSGRKGIGVLTALTPLLLLGLNGIIKDVSMPTSPGTEATTTVEQNVLPPKPKPRPAVRTTEQNTRTTPTTIPKTTNTEQKTTTREEPVRVTTVEQNVLPSKPKPRPAVRTTEQNTGATLTTVPKTTTPSGMVLIPAGEFQMGSNESDDEKPVHAVYIDDFYIDKYEVTNAQYKIFVDVNPQWRKSRIEKIYHDGDYLKHWSGNNYPVGKGYHPVTYVSWYAAMAYAEWKGKRLPTEAEWEKAARGGLKNKKYPWGDSINSNKANYGKNVGDVVFVGKYPSNNYGVYDMSGNVLEWCLDAYIEDFYVNASSQNPIAGASVLNVTANFSKVRTARVLRGGSWSQLSQYVRVADRTKGDPKLSYFGAGFRCVQAVTPTMTKTTTTDTKQKTTTRRTPVQTTDTTNTAPKSDILKVWVDHNQYQDSIKGMRIHVKFNVHNFKDGSGRVVAYFYKQNGDPLKDANGRYNTTTGDVSTSGKFQPGYVNSVYNDFKLFFPYKELHMARGKHNLKFRIRIFQFNNSGSWDALSDVSDWVHFTYSR